MRLKETLAKHGYIDKSQVTRGRPSRQMVEWGREVIDKGLETHIEGFDYAPNGTPAPAKPAAAAPKPAPKAGTVLDVPDMVRDEDLWTAHAEGKEIGFRTVCNGCRGSLGWCRCETPKVWVAFNREAPVTFKPRTKGAK